MEAKRPVSQHRDEMQDDAAKAEARKGQHAVAYAERFHVSSRSTLRRRASPRRR
jgi:hypothetical protein